MSQLQRLLNSFVATITQYHQQKLGAGAAETKTIEDLVAQTHPAMMKELSSYVMAATHQEETRRPLFLYLLHGIDRLKYLIDTTEPVEEAAKEIIKTQLVELMVTLQTLMKTSHSTLVTIQYNKKDYQLYGFIRGILSRYTLCTSGAILAETVFPTLGLKPEADPHTIEKTLNTIISEHLELIRLRYDLQELKNTQSIEEDQPLASPEPEPSRTPSVPLFKPPTTSGLRSILSPQSPIASFFKTRTPSSAHQSTPKAPVSQPMEFQ